MIRYLELRGEGRIRGGICRLLSSPLPKGMLQRGLWKHPLHTIQEIGHSQTGSAGRGQDLRAAQPRAWWAQKIISFFLEVKNGHWALHCLQNGSFSARENVPWAVVARLAVFGSLALRLYSGQKEASREPAYSSCCLTLRAEAPGIIRQQPGATQVC